MTGIGETLPSIVRGETNLLDTLTKDNMLSQFYSKALGAQSYLDEVARIAGQIGNRYPHVNILEIGELSRNRYASQKLTCSGRCRCWRDNRSRAS